MKEADLQALLDESVYSDYHVLLIDQSSAHKCTLCCIHCIAHLPQIPGKHRACVAGIRHNSTRSEAACQAGMAGDHSTKACQDGSMHDQMPAIHAQLGNALESLDCCTCDDWDLALV